MNQFSHKYNSLEPSRPEVSHSMIRKICYRSKPRKKLFQISPPTKENIYSVNKIQFSLTVNVSRDQWNIGLIMRLIPKPSEIVYQLILLNIILNNQGKH